MNALAGRCKNEFILRIRLTTVMTSLVDSGLNGFSGVGIPPLFSLIHVLILISNIFFIL
jgi:hypothetical protein